MATERKKAKKNSRFWEVMRRLRKNRLAMAGLVFLILMILISIFAPLIAPYGYETQDLYNMFALPSAEHPFGTDNLGRDIFSRIIYGGRASLTIGFASVAVSAVFGMTLGAIAGYYGGKVDMVIMRVLDVFQAVPAILMSIAISATLGPGLVNAILAIGLSTIPGYSRMTRASFMSVQGMEYIEAARAIHCGDRRIVLKHVLPNAVSPMIVQMTMGVGSCISVAAMLSFIGLGVQPPSPEWGAMLSAGRNYIRDYWHIVLFPGLAIMLTVLSLNMLGDGLRDALDPRLKN